DAQRLKKRSSAISITRLPESYSSPLPTSAFFFSRRLTRIGSQPLKSSREIPSTLYVDGSCLPALLSCYFSSCRLSQIWSIARAAPSGLSPPQSLPSAWRG